ncbi:hypothetical protein BH10ACI4_BH10ACI4_07990 [soil metagenome]
MKMNSVLSKLSLLPMLLLLQPHFGYASKPLRLKECSILLPQPASVQEITAATVATEEIEKRTGLHWSVEKDSPRSNCVLLLATQVDLEQAKSRFHVKTIRHHAKGQMLRAEGFRAGGWVKKSQTWILVEGADARGLLFGVGYLLRQFSMTHGSVLLPEGLASLETTQAPTYPVRGHQLGYRPKNNTFDGWTAAQFEQYIRDLAIFGTNTIELIPPRSDDDATSPLFTLPPLKMMKALSAIIDHYGLDCSIWYPAMDKDYADPATIEHAVAEWGEIFRALPRVDAVFVPGGDPGHTPPRYLFSLLEREAAELRRTHPKAQMWVSPQGFDAVWLSDFYNLLEAHPKWLTGVVYGPEMRESPEAFRSHVPSVYPIRFYPDITHTSSAQYPVPHWDSAFALTEGREPINPRPVDEGIIFHRYASLTNGFVAYSEGSNDDINKVLWSGWGWNPSQSANQILIEYGRYFVAPEVAKEFALGAAGLETNWRGPLKTNQSIPKTLALFERIGAVKNINIAENWRLQQMLYRANYDSYLQGRVRRESAKQVNALRALKEATPLAIKQALQAARSASSQEEQCSTIATCQRVSGLAADLFRTVRMQLSVPRYNALAVGRGANFDSIDAPINDLPWLRNQIEEVGRLSSDQEKFAAVEELIAALAPGQMSIVDDLGKDGRNSHLLKGVAFADDPSGLTGVYLGARSEVSKGEGVGRPKLFAGTLYDKPLQMRYVGLTVGSQYTVKVFYANDGADYQIRSNGVAIKQYCVHQNPCDAAEFSVTNRASADGSTILSWYPISGRGGNGRQMAIMRVELSLRSITKARK